MAHPPLLGTLYLASSHHSICIHRRRKSSPSGRRPQNRRQVLMWCLPFFFCHLLWGTRCLAQSPAPDSSPQAIAVLQQALSASGNADSATRVRSFVATGTATFFLPGPVFPQVQQVQGGATIRAQGSDQFRLDANLPGGIRSIARNRHAGTRKEEDGRYSDIPVHNTVSRGGSSFPYLPIAAALSDSTMTISYVGLVASGTQRAHQVRIVKNFPAHQDPTGLMSRLSQTDYFVDSQTNLVIKTADAVHPRQTATWDYPRETLFESYRTFNGVAVPTLVREKIAGQTTWEFRLAGISFNPTLNDSEFTILK